MIIVWWWCKQSRKDEELKHFFPFHRHFSNTQLLPKSRLPQNTQARRTGNRSLHTWTVSQRLRSSVNLLAKAERERGNAVDGLTLSNKVLFKLLEELEVEEIVGSEGLLSHHGLHGLNILPNGVAGVLPTQWHMVSDGGGCHGQRRGSTCWVSIFTLDFCTAELMKFWWFFFVCFFKKQKEIK